MLISRKMTEYLAIRAEEIGGAKVLAKRLGVDYTTAYRWIKGITVKVKPRDFIQLGELIEDMFSPSEKAIYEKVKREAMSSLSIQDSKSNVSLPKDPIFDIVMKSWEDLNVDEKADIMKIIITAQERKNKGEK